MTETTYEESHWTELRRKAERAVGRFSAGTETDRETLRLIHEVQIHQTKLELQNDELRRRQNAVEEARQRYENLYRNYAELFTFAPIGYLTFDQDGVIGDINVATAIIFDAPRSSLARRRITDFIHGDDQDVFYRHKLLCRKQEEAEPFEIKMKRSNGSFFDARLQMQRRSNGNGDESCYMLALMDITEITVLSSNFMLQQNCLEIAGTAENIQVLLRRCVDMVKHYLKCDAVGIRMLDPDGSIPYYAHDGFSRVFYDSKNPLSQKSDRCVCTAVIRGETDPDRFYFTPKGSFYMNETSRFLATLPTEELEETVNMCHAQGHESVLIVPIPVDNTIRGLIHAADRRGNVFPLRVVENIEAVGLRLGTAVQRFRLQERLSNTVDTLNNLSGRLLTAQEDELRRIAMELHDGCGQDLNVLKLNMKSLQNSLPPDAVDLRKKCNHLITIMDKIINDIRDVAHGLKPAALDVLGLHAAVRQTMREFAENYHVEVETELAPLDRIKTPSVQLCLFRVIQEALTNIAKHAQASWVTVTAEHDNDDFCIRIQDNGKGFDHRHRYDEEGVARGLGLSAMALRCRMIGATFSIDSDYGKGTRLIISFPYPSREPS